MNYKRIIRNYKRSYNSRISEEDIRNTRILEENDWGPLGPMVYMKVTRARGEGFTSKRFRPLECAPIRGGGPGRGH